MGDLTDKLGDLLAQADMRVRFWVCPLHDYPADGRTTVTWEGDVATCALCGFTSAEHRARVLRARAVMGDVDPTPRNT